VRLISLSRIHIICRLSRLPYYKVSNVYAHATPARKRERDRERERGGGERRQEGGGGPECVTQCNEWPPFEALTSSPTLCAFSRERKTPRAVNLKHVICKVVMVPALCRGSLSPSLAAALNDRRCVYVVSKNTTGPPHARRREGKGKKTTGRGGDKERGYVRTRVHSSVAG